ncbi:7279_t:CDS:2, partial [Cetraspora pellucida]
TSNTKGAKKKIVDSSEDEVSKSGTILSNKHSKKATSEEQSNNTARVPFEPLTLNDTTPTNNITWPYRQNQDLAYNYASTSLSNNPRPFQTINPALTYNSEHI